MRVLLLFLDGVGIGLDDPDRNPFLTAQLPRLRQILGGRTPTLPEPRIVRRAAAAFPLDANLGVDGDPQSGTGQAALLTGTNAAREMGRHFGPWTPVALRPLVEEESVLRRAQRGGHTAAFANAYPREWPDERLRGRVAPVPLAARAAGLMTRHEEALADGTAVASGIVNEGWIHHLGHTDLPPVDPARAGATLAGLAGDAGLTLFAHYDTDTAGHRGSRGEAERALERVDEFLGGVVDHLPDDVLLFVVSDHGNVEDMEAEHTRNPALGMLVGPGASERSEGLGSILDVADRVLGWLEE